MCRARAQSTVMTIVSIFRLHFWERSSHSSKFLCPLKHVEIRKWHYLVLPIEIYSSLNLVKITASESEEMTTYFSFNPPAFEKVCVLLCRKSPQLDSSGLQMAFSLPQITIHFNPPPMIYFANYRCLQLYVILMRLNLSKLKQCCNYPSFQCQQMGEQFAVI